VACPKPFDISPLVELVTVGMLVCCFTRNVFFNGDLFGTAVRFSGRFVVLAVVTSAALECAARCVLAGLGLGGEGAACSPGGEFGCYSGDGERELGEEGAKDRG
jgi:hypothetical protein